MRAQHHVAGIVNNPGIYAESEVKANVQDLTSANPQLKILLSAMVRNIKRPAVQQVFNALLSHLGITKDAGVERSRVAPMYRRAPVPLVVTAATSLAALNDAIQQILVAINELNVANMYTLMDYCNYLADLPGVISDKKEIGIIGPVLRFNDLVQQLRLEKFADDVMSAATRGGAEPVPLPGSGLVETVPVEEAKRDEGVHGKALMPMGECAYTLTYQAPIRNAHGTIVDFHPVTISVINNNIADYFNRPGIAVASIINPYGPVPNTGNAVTSWVRRKRLTGCAKAAMESINARHLDAVCRMSDAVLKEHGRGHEYKHGDLTAYELPQRDGKSLLLTELPYDFRGKMFEGKQAIAFQQTQFKLLDMARTRRYRNFVSPVPSAGHYGLALSTAAKAMAHAYRAQVDNHSSSFDHIVIVENSQARMLEVAKAVNEIFPVDRQCLTSGAPRDRSVAVYSPRVWSHGGGAGVAAVPAVLTAPSADPLIHANHTKS